MSRPPAWADITRAETVALIAAAEANSKVAVDAAATADYLGATAGVGALRTGSGLTKTDGGNFITVAVDVAAGSTAALAAIDVAAAPGYIGATAGAGILRTTGITKTDGGDFITLTPDVTDASVIDNAIDALISTHAGLADPHTVYQLESGLTAAVIAIAPRYDADQTLNQAALIQFSKNTGSWFTIYKSNVDNIQTVVALGGTVNKEFVAVSLPYLGPNGMYRLTLTVKKTSDGTTTVVSYATLGAFTLYSTTTSSHFHLMGSVLACRNSASAQIWSGSNDGATSDGSNTGAIDISGGGTLSIGAAITAAAVDGVANLQHCLVEGLYGA